MSKKDKKDLKKSDMVKAAGVGAMFGVIVGALIGLFNAPKKGEELREDVKKTLNEMKGRLSETSEELQMHVKKSFGTITSETLELYADVKQEIIDRVKTGKKDLEKQDYNKIVDDVVSSFKKERGEFKTKLENLRGELKKEWNSMKKLADKATSKK